MRNHENSLRVIKTRNELKDLANELNMQFDWHEPDEQDVTATVVGHTFDNAGFWPLTDTNAAILEQHVILLHDGVAVAAVNLATLFAWATGLECS
jgi:hypothetical protein